MRDFWYTVNGQKDKLSPRNAKFYLDPLLSRDKQTVIKLEC